MDVETVDIHLVAVVLERYNNVKISIVNGNMPYRLVSVHLVNVPIHAAIETIAISAGAKINQDVAGIYVFTPAPTIVTQTMTFVPPTHFIGAAGDPFAGTTFGDPAPGNYSNALSGLCHRLIFRIGRAESAKLVQLANQTVSLKHGRFQTAS